MEIRDMSYDYKNARWQGDIASFGRWKTFLNTMPKGDSPHRIEIRERVRGYMRDIQKRWPQYIKVDEIP
jgi:hypothetical protein